MSENYFSLKVFSDSRNLVSITSALKQLELKGFLLNVSYPSKFEIESNDIIIIKIESLDSPLYKNLLRIRKGKTNKFVIVIDNSDALMVSSLIKQGFWDIFVFPYEVLKFVSFLTDVISNKSYITEVNRTGVFGMNQQGIKSIVGNSEKLLNAVEMATKVSEKSNSNVLLLGETGTGKGLFARAIHNNSSAGQYPFVDIVCTSIPETLLESELFGYEAGAFTDARTRKIGLFELAERGTLFLDEIGDLSNNIQTKLLRAIEKKVIKRLGGVVDIPINARIISATNRNLAQMVEKKLFRSDLFHRLNVVSIEIPALRERGTDVILLANHFIEEFNKQFNKSVKAVDKDIQHFLMGYSWPGNVRELRNAIERAVLLCEDKKLRLEDFSNIINKAVVKTNTGYDEQEIPSHIIRMDVSYGVTNLRKLEKQYAKQVLTKLGGNKTRTAKLLGISRPKLDDLLKN
ncbi:MAG: sigma-54-dependent Fis family transcriptional regulator [Ignavibacteriaceae bacterium]|nr:sigma-54-dependent Fis family transcriptional regulator [Ignavibacteriaceae bacterium]